MSGIYKNVILGVKLNLNYENATKYFTANVDRLHRTPLLNY